MRWPMFNEAASLKAVNRRPNLCLESDAQASGRRAPHQRAALMGTYKNRRHSVHSHREGWAVFAGCARAVGKDEVPESVHRPLRAGFLIAIRRPDKCNAHEY